METFLNLLKTTVIQFLINNYFSGPLKLNTIKAYAGQIVNILEYLYSMGVIHRDLKVNNNCFN